MARRRRITRGLITAPTASGYTLAIDPTSGRRRHRRLFSQHQRKSAISSTSPYWPADAFGNGISALMTLLGIRGRWWCCSSSARDHRRPRARRVPNEWLDGWVHSARSAAASCYRGVGAAKRFRGACLGHRSTRITVTLCSLLSAPVWETEWSRSSMRTSMPAAAARSGIVTVGSRIEIGLVAEPRGGELGDHRIARLRLLVAAAMLVPIGSRLGIPMPTGPEDPSARAPPVASPGRGG